MNIIGITRFDIGTARKCLGLPYAKCAFDDEDDVLFDMDVSEIESQIQHKCLLLPLIDDSNYVQEFAIFYDDWDVSDDKFEKCLPRLCTRCFEMDGLLS